MFAIFVVMFTIQLKAIQITASHQAPLLLIFQMTGAAHSAALAKAIFLQKRKQVIMTKGSAICRAFFVSERVRQSINEKPYGVFSNFPE